MILKLIKNSSYTVREQKRIYVNELIKTDIVYVIRFSTATKIEIIFDIHQALGLIFLIIHYIFFPK